MPQRDQQNNVKLGFLAFKKFERGIGGAVGNRQAREAARIPLHLSDPSKSGPTHPSIPRDAEGPVFRAPWEAQAFGMAVKLHEAGYFSWHEWAERLAAEIKRAQDRGDPDLGTTYYEHWLAALEPIVTENRRGTRGSFDSGYDLAIPHIRIFEAIERRDPETAALVMRQHLQDLMRYLPSSYRR